MNFSKRSQWPTEENSLTLLLKTKKYQGVEIIDLTQSNPTRCGFEALKNPLFQKVEVAEAIFYEPNPKGLLKAREAVARYYAQKNVQVVPEQIILTSSTSEAYTYLFRLLGNPGEVVLAPCPGYPLFDYLLGLNDLQLEKYSLGVGPAWRLDKESLVNLSKSNPQALIWINPNNPTGNYASVDELNYLNDFSIQNSCPLIVDEVFLDYPRQENGKPRSFAANDQTLTFTLSGISKILGLPQMKLSWIIVSGPKDQREEAMARLEMIADMYLSVSTPIQHALPQWLALQPKINGEILARVRANEKTLKDLLAGSKIQVLNAEGGWYSVLRLPEGVRDEDFCQKLLQEKNILIHPGYLFDFPDENYLVISLLPTPKTFKKAIELITS